MTATNPLLEATVLPAFSKIRPEHVEPAIDTLLDEARRALDELLAEPEKATWATLIEPLTLIDNRLERAWSPVSHLNSVMNSEELRAAYDRCMVKLTSYSTERGQNARLFRAYQAIYDTGEDLSDEQRRVLENALRDFRLSGVDLPDDRKARYRAISEELSTLASDFQNKVLDATHAWSKHVTDAAALRGLPASALDLARQTAEQRGLEGFVLTLDFPSYLPVMTYAEDAALREEVYRAFNTRASDEGPQAGEFDNTRTMERLLDLRHEQAQLLGFANYAERSLATKMARSTDEVMNFLEDLVRRSKPQAEKEYAALAAYAREEHGHERLEAWDIAFFSEKLRQHLHSITEEELKPYFPANHVIDGMFEVVGRLFGVRFARRDGVDIYHPDVLFYDVHDEAGALRAQFYFDLYARPKKRGGAWMADAQSRMVVGGTSQIPVAFMTCNFTPPVNGRPPLLTHREVETLFHEFGHGLHHMLTRVGEPAIAGINGVAWDAVELPSQFMENYCWEREALDLFARHHETGDPLPTVLYERMLAAKSFQSAMMMARQLEFSIFDFRLHREYDPAAGARIYAILEETREQVAVVHPPAWNRFAHGFSHIFGGGYAAGYYSYKWAEVLSADAFSLFEERGVFDEATGRSFLVNILERGGSKDAMDLFVAFRGREPETDALLRHSGIAA
jgi:oligopeptidase A